MNWIITLTTFLAASVEWVEALTIVLAAGLTVGWRPALRGTFLGLGVLAVSVAVLGLALAKLVFLKGVLQIIIGLFLLLFGLRWLSKATLRSAGFVALHDEEKAFAAETSHLQKAAHAQREAQVVSFQGVLLEGLEVAFIVIAFGSSAAFKTATENPLLSAIVGALASLVLVVGVGFITHKPLSRVPENTLKYVVGLGLSSFGVFWSGEGLGVVWPGADLVLLGLLLIFLLATQGMVVWLRQRRAQEA
ncbi:MAG: hypothetical protein IVW51_01060 [Thermaceae bacterium]|nr:hypothetical protein [Thermaceae bacterium]